IAALGTCFPKPCCRIGLRRHGARPRPQITPSRFALALASRLVDRAGAGLDAALCLLGGLPVGHGCLPSGSHRACRAACTTASPALGARRAATQEGPSTRTAMLAVRGSRAECEAKRFSLAASYSMLSGFAGYDAQGRRHS